MAVVCLIYEVHCYLGRESEWPGGWLPALARKLSGGPVAAPGDTLGSIWILDRPLDPNDEYAEVARKVVGPLPREQAQAAMAALRAALESAGVQVVEETVADD